MATTVSPIVHVFDDNYSEVRTAKAYMDKYAMPGTNAVICDTLGTAGHLTADECVAWQAHSGWATMAHSWTAADHNLPNGLRDLGSDALNAANFRQMKDYLLAIGANGADHIAYPKGQWDATVEGAAKRYFASGRTTLMVPPQTLPFTLPMRVQALSVTDTTTVQSIKDAIDACVAAGDSLLVIVWHKVVSTTPASSIEYALADFQTIIDYHVAKGATTYRNYVDVMKQVATPRPMPTVVYSAISSPSVAYAVASTDGSPVNNSTALVADTRLTVPVAASATYEVSADIVYDSATGADIKLGWLAPAGATLSWTALAPGVNVTAHASSNDIASLTTTRWTVSQVPSFGGVDAGSKITARVSGLLTTGTTAGNLQLQWAQNAATVADTYVRSGSFIRLLRIA